MLADYLLVQLKARVWNNTGDERGPQRLVLSCESEWIAAFLRNRFRVRFGVGKGVPRENRDDGRSTKPIDLQSSPPNEG